MSMTLFDGTRVLDRNDPVWKMTYSGVGKTFEYEWHIYNNIYEMFGSLNINKRPETPVDYLKDTTVGAYIEYNYEGVHGGIRCRTEFTDRKVIHYYHSSIEFPLVSMSDECMNQSEIKRAMNLLSLLCWSSVDNIPSNWIETEYIQSFLTRVRDMNDAQRVTMGKHR